MSNILDLFKLTGKVAIVTGGAGLLGKEFCRTLSQAGARVILGDVNTQAAETVAGELTAEGLSVMPVGVDITSPDSVEALVNAALKAYGQVDVLVNSAAMDPKFDPQREGRHGNTFEDYPLSAWKQALDINLTGAFLCCQAVARPMLAQNRGAIINLSSIYGVVAPNQRLYQAPGKPPQYKPAYYTVTKAGILGLTKYLATYFAGHNIRVNALTPGGVYNKHDEAFVRGYSALSVMGRMAERDEMNGALLFLASDASVYMTGSNLIVDGGWTAW